MLSERKNIKVLIVDDEPHIALALEFLMQKEGYTVTKAYDGEAAIEVMDSFFPDIVLLDVMMPGIDGFEVAKTIRSNPSYEHTRIIFLTAKGTSSDKIKGYTSGGEVYITKPFDNDELINIINEVIEFG